MQQAALQSWCLNCWFYFLKNAVIQPKHSILNDCGKSTGKFCQVILLRFYLDLTCDWLMMLVCKICCFERKMRERERGERANEATINAASCRAKPLITQIAFQQQQHQQSLKSGRRFTKKYFH